jgi:hypothetical protein
MLLWKEEPQCCSGVSISFMVCASSEVYATSSKVFANILAYSRVFTGTREHAAYLPWLLGALLADCLLHQLAVEIDWPLK